MLCCRVQWNHCNLLCRHDNLYKHLMCLISTIQHKMLLIKEKCVCFLKKQRDYCSFWVKSYRYNTLWFSEMLCARNKHLQYVHKELNWIFFFFLKGEISVANTYGTKFTLFQAVVWLWHNNNWWSDSQCHLCCFGKSIPTSLSFYTCLLAFYAHPFKLFTTVKLPLVLFSPYHHMPLSDSLLFLRTTRNGALKKYLKYHSFVSRTNRHLLLKLQLMTVMWQEPWQG